MTPERAKELLPVIQAFAEGKPVQYKNDGEWKDVNPKYGLAWFDNCDYRVKPKEETWYYNVYRGLCAAAVDRAHISLAGAKSDRNPHYSPLGIIKIETEDNKLVSVEIVES